MATIQPSPPESALLALAVNNSIMHLQLTQLWRLPHLLQHRQLETVYATSTPGMPHFREDINRDAQSASPFSPGASNTPHLRGGASSFISPSVASFGEDAAYTNFFSAKRTVQNLLDMGGPPPPRSTSDPTSSPNMIDEIKHLYYSIYAPGLENFLESKWFSVKGLAKLLSGKHLLESFAALLQQFGKTSQNDPKELAYTQSVETRTVWALASMVREVAAETNGMREYKTVPATDDPIEAINRLNVFETLLTGRVAAANPLTAPVPGSTDHHRLRELEFWHTLAQFVTLQYEDGNAIKEVDDTLAALRNLLDGRENRDVLYSIAVVRGLGQRVSEYTENDQPLHLDESDNKSKLLVAKKFVSDEANGSGTTNVIRRLCDMATRSWSCILLISRLCSIPKGEPGSFLNSRSAGRQAGMHSRCATKKRSHVSINTGSEGKIFLQRAYTTSECTLRMGQMD
jgi:hypothetical protein